MKELLLNRWMLDLITEFRWGQFPEIPILWKDGLPERIENLSEKLPYGQKEVQWFSVDKNGDHWRIQSLDNINDTDQYIVRVEAVYTSPQSPWTNEGKTKSMEIKIWQIAKKEE